MKTLGFTDKKYHLEGNLFIRGFKSFYNSYDETYKYYNIEKLKSNSKFREIFIEYNCGFFGSYDTIPIDIIDRFSGFEEDELPKEEGWFLGICAVSQFLEVDEPHRRSYNGPGIDWYKDSMIWWEKNEEINSIFRFLAEKYVYHFVLKSDMHKFSTGCFLNSLKTSIINYILENYGVNYLINFVNNTETFKLYYLLFIINTHDFYSNFEERYKYKLELAKQGFKCNLEEALESYNKSLEIVNLLELGG